TLAALLSSGAVVACIDVGFYDTTCPSAETLVQQTVAAAFGNDSGVAPAIIRLHFHDCFVKVSQASQHTARHACMHARTHSVHILTCTGIVAGVRRLRADRLDAWQQGGEGLGAQLPQPPLLRRGGPRQGGPRGAVPRRRLLRRRPRLRGAGQRRAVGRPRVPGARRAPGRPCVHRSGRAQQPARADVHRLRPGRRLRRQEPHRRGHRRPLRRPHHRRLPLQQLHRANLQLPQHNRRSNDLHNSSTTHQNMEF
uniref:Plant heme peroxidase family profile domain-containing protein n=1 Tax=Aegilops tauschii subsp. strangulata TaxID=200361 RepID=A0A452Y327_AEGTS